MSIMFLMFNQPQESDLDWPWHLLLPFALEYHELRTISVFLKQPGVKGVVTLAAQQSFAGKKVQCLLSTVLCMKQRSHVSHFQTRQLSVGQSAKHAKLIMHIPFENKWISPRNIKCDHTLRVLFRSTMAMPHFMGATFWFVWKYWTHIETLNASRTVSYICSFFLSCSYVPLVCE